ncbi:CAP domain-containing protein [Mitsuokella jalaludinii]|uniref:CAP domain-containing protein n=1 Tax=Mitsuokella jalaludinii TaxID=187979 RepID=UPI003F9E5932
MKTLRQIVALLVMVMTVFASSTAFAASLQDEVLYYVNVERVAAGVQPLTAAVNLNAAAGIRAQEAGIVFAHQRPDGSSVKSVLNGESCSWFGENLAISSVMDAQKIVRAWMGSPTHRANLLNHHFTQMGVSCVRGSDGHYYWAQEFVGN